MGSIFSRILTTAAPVVAAVAPLAGPAGVAIGTAASIKVAQDQKKKAKAQQEEYNKRRASMAGDPFLTSYMPSQPTTTGVNSASSGGFGSSFGTFLSDVGRNILNPIGNIFSSPAVQPFISQQSRGQPALPTQSTQRGQESSGSGVSEAFMGPLGNILGQAGRFLRTPAGQIGTGTAVGGALSLMGGQPSGVRITRKMKSQYRTVLNLAQGDYAMAADIIGVPQDFFISVLLKRFRNDGPVVTKAALRKTKTTVRRLKNMCDMYDSLRPTATRRRSPMKRASTTLISNK